MALYIDEVARVTQAQLKSQLAPRVYRAAKSVRLEHAGYVAEVAIVMEESAGCHGGVRRRLRCPRCGEMAFVLGCVPGVGWGCRACTRWRGRNRPRRWGDERVMADEPGVPA